MDDLTRVLRDYAFRCLLEGCYCAASREEREDSERMVGRNMELLQTMCSTETLDRVHILLETQEGIRAEDMDAAFACGLKVGLALR